MLGSLGTVGRAELLGAIFVIAGFLIGANKVNLEAASSSVSSSASGPTQKAKVPAPSPAKPMTPKEILFDYRTAIALYLVTYSSSCRIISSIDSKMLHWRRALERNRRGSPSAVGCLRGLHRLAPPPFRPQTL